MRWCLAAILLVGCGKTDSAPPTGAGAQVGTTGAVVGPAGAMPTGSPVTTTGTLPADPRPVSITFSGDLNETIVFDTPSCSHYPSPAFVNFRSFWRGSTHNAVLIAEVLSDFTGAGTYNTTDHNLRVKLQTEAGTTYTFDLFQVDALQGDSATMTVDHVGEIAYGSVDITGMHSNTGALTATPSTFPIWCEAVEN